MKYEEHLPTKEMEKLRDQIRLLSSKVNDNVYNQRKDLFGRVATIVDASTPDPEQRKSIKDLVSEAIFGPSYWNGMSIEFNNFAEAQGFKLYSDLPPVNVDAMPYKTENPYEKV